MGSKRITELRSLTAADLTAGTDFLHIIDDSAAISGKNKKITVQELLEGAGGVDPLPYRYKEVFQVHNADIHTVDNKNSHTAPHIWVAPPSGAFKDETRIRCWGAGGGGGGGNNSGIPGGGGGAGAFSEVLFTYVPGVQYLIYVGVAGTQGIGASNNANGQNGSNGAQSKITNLANTMIVISTLGGSGGLGGLANGTGGTGGLGAVGAYGIGDLRVDGAAGSDKLTNNLYGGTGGGSYRGGSGGRGGSSSDSGDARDGNFPGGGGGGGSPNTGGSTGFTKSHGGNGGPGLIIIEYNNSPAAYSYKVHSP
jgi:hypothetical protein